MATPNNSLLNVSFLNYIRYSILFGKSQTVEKQFSPNRYTTDEEIVAFAKSIGIHPGIVAGRLQHEKIIPPNRCSHLKEKYVFSF